jgi:signal peptidase
MSLYSGDMQFAFYNYGDLLLLTNYHEEPIRAGDTVVFGIEGRDIDIIHRVVRVHER